MKYGLSEKQLGEIIDFIAQHPEVETAVLFGSRALGTYKEASDVDIALHGEKVNLSLAAKMKFNIEEDTYLPFMFDFVAYPTITNEALRKHIDTKGVVIFRRGGREWKEGTLADMAEVVMGQSPLGETCNSVGEGVPLLNGPTEFGNRYPTPVQFTVDPKKFSEIDDILFCVRGSTTGRMNWSNQRYALGRGLAAIRHNKGREYRYFTRGVLDLNLPILLASATGSTFPNVSRDQLTNLELLIPPLPEQRAIASILSSLDDKIDLLHRQNKTLEAMAETLFRQWFVEEAQENWEVAQMKKYVDVGIGRTPPRNQHQWFSLNPKDVKWISIKDLGNEGVYSFETAEYLTPDAVTQFNIPVIPENTVVLSFKMTVGRVAITTEQMLSNEAIAHFKFWNDTPFSVEYLYLYLKRYQYDLLGSTSSIVTAINSSMIKEMELAIPDEMLMLRFDESAKRIFQKIRSNQVHARTLENLRDTLLPKLMSGEVSVDCEQ